MTETVCLRWPLRLVYPVTLRGALLRGCLDGLLGCLLIEVGNLLFFCNVHVVVPGAVYRCAQPSGQNLEWLARKYGIRTVINLRGCREQQDWYRQEAQAANRLGISTEDVALSAGHLPPVQEIKRLVQVLDHSEYPVLFHCYRGVDRTGLASALALLLRTDVSLKEGRRALSLRYVHLPWGRTGRLDEFFDLYEEWLKERGQAHSREAFRTWLEHDYCGGACSARLEVISPVRVGPRAAVLNDGKLTWVAGQVGDATADVVTGRLRVPREQAFALRLRCTNTSIRTWHFTPDLSAGIHATWTLQDAQAQKVDSGMAGRFHADVPPGESIELTLALAPLRFPGVYSLQIDLEEAQHCPFHQAGSEPLDLELEVP